MWDIKLEGDREVYIINNNSVVLARFKYANPRKSAKHFVKFLVANFTPEEYYAKRLEGKAPLTILKEKGYISYNESRLSK